MHLSQRFQRSDIYCILNFAKSIAMCDLPLVGKLLESLLTLCLRSLGSLGGQLISNPIRVFHA